MIKKQKIFKPLVDAVVKALIEIFNENRKADKVIAGILKSNPKWGSRDRAFIAENTYEIVRNWRLLKFCAEIQKVETETEFLKIVGIWLVIDDVSIEGLNYFESIDEKLVKIKFEEAQKDRKLKYSVPNWMDEICSEQLGEQWEAELQAMHQKAEVFLRVNTLKITKEKLMASLAEKQVNTFEVPNVATALKLEKRSNVFGLEEFRKGFFEVQDAGSQLIADYLDVSSGQRVVDACAGAGGKSLQIATAMGNKGKVISLDIEEFKLLELKKRAARNGIDTIETRLIEPKTMKRLVDSADRLLLDVPCSGLGVLKRNPDAKWKLKPEFIEEIAQTQAMILNDYSKILKKGGKMVYATCSILRTENEDQVEKFLLNNPEFSLIKQQRISPAKDGFDGFYMALIQRN